MIPYLCLIDTDNYLVQINKVFMSMNKEFNSQRLTTTKFFEALFTPDIKGRVRLKMTIFHHLLILLLFWPTFFWYDMSVYKKKKLQFNSWTQNEKEWIIQICQQILLILWKEKTQKELNEFANENFKISDCFIHKAIILLQKTWNIVKYRNIVAPPNWKQQHYWKETLINI